MNQLSTIVEKEFASRFKCTPTLVRSPGRVNLIGGHTDYNQGFVLPAAVDKAIYLAMSLNEKGKIQLYSIDREQSFSISLDEDLPKSEKGWPNYILGVVDQLRKVGHNPAGFNCVFSGNIPMGAGMSSSAALEGGVVFGLNQLFGFSIRPEKMAGIAQKAENDFVGVQCGIMDQFISLNGKKDHVMKLDCRSLEYEHYPFRHDDIRFVVCDTQVRRELASSEYNVRRRQCEEGVQLLQQYDSSIESLRDVRTDLLKKHKNEFDSTVFKRCDYIVSENKRVMKACDDLVNDDLDSFGQRMYESHDGLRDQYEVSCSELDILVKASRTIDGVLGARMMGGGFGGCTINLVKKQQVEPFKKQIKDIYLTKTGRQANVYQTKVSAGTTLISNQNLRSKQA